MGSYRWLLVVALGAFSPAAVAAPSISIVDHLDGTASLRVATDAPGALAAELALELTDVTLIGATVNSAVFDQANPGDSPYVAGSPVQGDAHGLELDLENNRLFAAFGADDPGVGEFTFLEFSYAGIGSAHAIGYVAQDGVLGPLLESGSTSLGDNVVICVCGDFDGDGRMGDSDLTLLLSHWGNPVPPVPAGWIGAQPTAPGIGDDEFTALLSTWGLGWPRAIPEPGALFLATVALLAGARRQC